MILNNSTIESKQVDLKISKVIVNQFIVQSLLFFIMRITGDNNTLNFIFAIISMCIVGIMFLSILKYVIRRKKNIFIVIYFFSLIYLLFNILIVPSSLQYYIKYTPNIFLINIPTFLYVLSIKDVSVLDSELDKKKNILLFINFISFLIILLNRDRDYYSGFSDLMIIPIMLYLSSFLKERKLKDLFFLTVSILIIIFVGTRGPLVSVAIFFLLYLLNVAFNRKKDIRGIIYFIFTIIFIVIIILNLNPILYQIGNILSKIGFTGRTIELFKSNPFRFSGREDIYGLMLDSIKSNPIFGKGLFGDRLVLEGTPFEFQYAHNLFLELIVDFGFVGIFLSIVLLLKFIKVIFSENIKNTSIVIVVLGFVGLMISGSFIISQNFAFGLALMMIYKKNQGKKTKGYFSEEI